MTNITFTKASGDDSYSGSFSASMNFNLHIEGGGDVEVYQKTGGNNPALVKTFSEAYEKFGVIDFDFSASVWPKDILIVCTKLPTIGGYTLDS